MRSPESCASFYPRPLAAYLCSTRQARSLRPALEVPFLSGRRGNFPQPNGAVNACLMSPWGFYEAITSTLITQFRDGRLERDIQPYSHPTPVESARETRLEPPSPRHPVGPVRLVNLVRARWPRGETNAFPAAVLHLIAPHEFSPGNA